MTWLTPIIVAVIEWMLNRLVNWEKKNDTASDAGGNSDLVRDIRDRVYAYKSRIRAARRARQDRP